MSNYKPERIRSLNALSAENRWEGELLWRFGDRYRMFMDEDGSPYLRCRRGKIYVHGKEWLSVLYRTTRPNLTLATIQAVIPEVKKTQVGDGEMILVCPLSKGQAFLDYLQALKRPNLTAGDLQARTERIQAWNVARISRVAP